jgi:hypothetical protein
MRYNSHEYVNDYLTYGTFPKIHDDIVTLAKTISNANELNAIDLGACTGLLTIRMGNIFKSVIGIESSEEYTKRSVQGANISVFKITPESLHGFGAVISGYDIIIARRVFPELHDAKVVYLLPEIFKNTGVKYILLEGRKQVKRPTNPLWNADLEAQVFSDYYIAIECYKEVRLLRRKIE